jgi:hypothetical protein
MIIPAHLQLRVPSDPAPKVFVTETDRAFRMGPRIHPNRAAYEFYPTPPEATRALLAVESFDGDIWEPACGEGHISRELEAHRYRVISTDLATCWGYGDTGRDFLAERKPLAKHIITNPPYGRGLADAFAKHAIKLTAETGGSVAMLMNLSGLCHPMRHDFYVSQPPAVIYALDECTCWPYGDPKRATTSIAKQRYCWIVWKTGHTGPTSFQWLSTAPYRDTPPLKLHA